jgi:head-tail adaptor
VTGAGDLRERIAFDARIEADDGLGNVRSDWTFQFELSAERKALRGGEEVMAGFILRLRQSSQSRRITPAMRARDARTGETYNIRTVTDPDGRRAWLDILCEAGVADG